MNLKKGFHRLKIAKLNKQWLRVRNYEETTIISSESQILAMVKKSKTFVPLQVSEKKSLMMKRLKMV